eukprot:6178657-Pleurochrysis_carterae.AAC.4
MLLAATLACSPARQPSRVLTSAISTLVLVSIPSCSCRPHTRRMQNGNGPIRSRELTKTREKGVAVRGRAGAVSWERRRRAVAREKSADVRPPRR